MFRDSSADFFHLGLTLSPPLLLVDHTKIKKNFDLSIQKTRIKLTWYFHKNDSLIVHHRVFLWCSCAVVNTSSVYYGFDVSAFHALISVALDELRNIAACWSLVLFLFGSINFLCIFLIAMQQKQPLKSFVQKLTCLLFFKFASDHNPWKLHVK